MHPEDEPPHAPAAAPSALREPGDVAPLSPPPPPPERPPEAAPTPGPKRGFFARVGGVIYDYFVGEDLNFGVAVVPLCFLAMVLFTRHPTKTNFIFDEQTVPFRLHRDRGRSDA